MITSQEHLVHIRSSPSQNQACIISSHISFSIFQSLFPFHHIYHLNSTTSFLSQTQATAHYLSASHYAQEENIMNSATFCIFLLKSFQITWTIFLTFCLFTVYSSLIFSLYTLPDTKCAFTFRPIRVLGHQYVLLLRGKEVSAVVKYKIRVCFFPELQSHLHALRHLLHEPISLHIKEAEGWLSLTLSVAA